MPRTAPAAYAAGWREHVRVRVGDEAYALPMDVVIEVGELEAPTPVPGAPFGVLGVLNRRARCFPVMDLAAVLGIEARRDAYGLVVAEAGGTRTVSPSTP